MLGSVVKDKRQDELVHACHARNIKVTIDVVPNHCSNQHELFKAAVAAGKGSPERDLFHFRDGRGENGEIAPSTFGEQSEMRLSRDELISASGVADAQLVELESFGLITLRGRHYDADALSVAKAVSEMASFGIEARHLRSFKTAADREIGLIEQVITPFTRQKSTEAKARAEEVQKEIASLSVRLHAALVRGGLNRPR